MISKWIQSLGILLILCIMIYPMSKIDHTSLKKVNSTYYLASNENRLFDRNMIPNGQGEEQCYYSPSLRWNNLGFSFHKDLSTLFDSHLYISAIYPSYSLSCGKPPHEKISIKLIGDSGKAKIFQKDIFIKIEPYVNLDNYIFNNHIFKTYETNSGVFISQSIYQMFMLYGVKENLEITLPVSVPVAYEKVNEDVYGEILEMQYVSQYQTIDYTFQVAGIYADDSQSFSVYIPYETTYDIYNQVYSKEIVTSDNEFLFEPNIWKIECNQEIEMDMVADSLQQHLDNFVLEDALYEIESRKVYK